MHIAYTEQQQWIPRWDFSGETIVCEIRENGHAVVMFALPVVQLDDGRIPAHQWDYARERTWSSYARYRVRQAEHACPRRGEEVSA